MKVLIINGSPRAEGNTAAALAEMVKIFHEQEVETEIIQIGKQVVRGCIACGGCKEKGACVFDDIVNETAAKLRDADGFVIASPVYFASVNGSLVSLLDRLMYSTGASIDKTMKVAAGLAVARRAGTTATVDVLNKYIMYGGFAVATSQYWNVLHGRAPGEVLQDDEGMQIVRTLARNMVFLMKSIALGKEQYGLPEKEEWTPTNFIH